MCLMAAEELGIPYEKVRTIIADTSSLGYNDVTDGSRTTFSTRHGHHRGRPRLPSSKLCGRAAKIWGIPPEAVVWEKGYAKPAGANAGNFEPLSLADIAARRPTPAARSPATTRSTPMVPASASPLHLCDAEVDKETGRVQVKRYTVFQDAGKAIHPELRRGPVPGRRGAGHRLGAERGATSTARTDGCRMRASSTTAFPSAPTCR